MAARFYRGLESVSIALDLSTALTIYPCQIESPGPSTLTVLNSNFLQLGVVADHRGQFTPGGYLSTVKHTTLAGIEPTGHNLPIVSPTYYQQCYRDHQCRLMWRVCSWLWGRLWLWFMLVGYYVYNSTRPAVSHYNQLWHCPLFTARTWRRSVMIIGSVVDQRSNISTDERRWWMLWWASLSLTSKQTGTADYQGYALYLVTDNTSIFIRELFSSASSHPLVINYADYNNFVHCHSVPINVCHNHVLCQKRFYLQQ